MSVHLLVQFGLWTVQLLRMSLSRSPSQLMILIGILPGSRSTGSPANTEPPENTADSSLFCSTVKALLHLHHGRRLPSCRMRALWANQSHFACGRSSITGKMGCRFLGQYDEYLVVFASIVGARMDFVDLEHILQAIDERMVHYLTEDIG
jgi:hypothetical protein